MVSKDQRRRQLARDNYQKWQQRRADQRFKARRRNLVIAAAVAVALVAGGVSWATISLVSGGDDANAEASATATASASASKVPDPCKKAAKGSPSKKQWSKEPVLTVDAKGKYTATLETTCGKITIELDAAKAPHTVNSFAFLAGQGYFDHSKCHRLVTMGLYVLQCGDPTGTGSGGPGYTLKDENLKGAKYTAGTVAMANAGPNTGGSQFFISYENNELPASYTPFGKITSGLDVVKKIAQAGDQTGSGDGPPNATVVLNQVNVVKS